MEFSRGIVAAVCCGDRHEEEGLLTETDLLSLNWDVVPPYGHHVCFAEPLRNVSPVTSARIQSVKAALLEKFPLAEALLQLGPGHTLIAGGSIVRTLQPEDTSHYGAPDCDFFYHSIDSEGATALLQKQIELIQQEGPVSIFVSTHTVTVVSHFGNVYQFILRLFRNPFHILASFDLAVCRIGLSVEGLVATRGGAVSLLTRSIIADVERMNASSSPVRLQKYHRMGYRVIVPHLQSFGFCSVYRQCIIGGRLEFQQYWPSTCEWKSEYFHVHGPESKNRSKDEISDYGVTPASLLDASLFNYRRARDGEGEFTRIASSWSEARNGGEVAGADEEDLSEWFTHASFMVRETHVMCWEI